LEDLLRQFPDCNVTIRRSIANIGGGPNVLRCFESAEAPWLWLLGDDDEPRPDAIATILEHIGAHRDCVFFNFSTGYYSRSKSYSTHGTAEFVRRLDKFNNVLFISAGVYRQASMWPNLHTACPFINSHAPHFALLLLTIGSDGKCYFSKSITVDWTANNRGDHWSFLDVASGLSYLFDLRLPLELKRELYRQVYSDMPGVEEMYRMLMERVGDDRSRAEASYRFDQICARVLPLEQCFRKRSQMRLMRLYFRLPQAMSLRLRSMRAMAGVARHSIKACFTRGRGLNTAERYPDSTGM
jgi:hypothetical protein